MAIPLAALPALFSAGVGAYQLIKGIQEEKNARERPEFEIPDAAQEALANAKYQASQTELPGQNLMEDKLRRNIQNTIFNTTRAASSPTQVLAAANAANEAYNDAQMDLAIKGSQRYDANQGQLRGELNRMAGWEQLDWIQDEWNPYMQEQQRIQSLKSGAFNNLQSAINVIPEIKAGEDARKAIEASYSASQLSEGGDQTVPKGPQMPTYETVPPKETGFGFNAQDFTNPMTPKKIPEQYPLYQRPAPTLVRNPASI